MADKENQQFADEVVSELAVIMSEQAAFHHLAEAYLGTWTTPSHDQLVITAVRHEGTSYFRVMGFDLAPERAITPVPEVRAMDIWDSTYDPSELHHEHGRVGIGGAGHDALNEAWIDDRPLIEQWAGLRRLS